MKKFITILADLLDNPISRGAAFALWAVPIYFLLNIKISVSDYEHIKNFIEWFGVPYGLLLALVLVNVWTQFDATDRAFDREADAVLKAYDTFLFTSDEAVKKDVSRLLYIYSKHVRKHYFNEYEVKIKKYLGDLILNKVRGAVGVLLQGSTDKILSMELLRVVNELIDERGDRLSYSKQRIPTPVLVLSLVTSFIWLGPFFALDFESSGLAAVFIGGVALIVVAILLIIIDLDDPIGGTWDVNLDAWDELIETIKN